MPEEERKARWVKRKERMLAELKEKDQEAYMRRINRGKEKKEREERAKHYWATREDRDCVSSAKEANKRGKKYSAIGVVKPIYVYKLMWMQNGRCAECKTEIVQSFHLDHVVALANGGSNEESNLQLLCGPCNTRKGSKETKLC